MKDKKKNKNGKHGKHSTAAAESADILGPTDEEREAIIGLLATAYGMELETVQNYLANSVNLDGVRAEQIKLALNADVAGELAHATQVANRIKQLGGKVPGSLKLTKDQKVLQPPADNTDVVAVIRGVLAAEEAAITQYRKIIKACEGKDYVTQDMAVTLLGDEEAHRIEFMGFLKEYAKG